MIISELAGGLGNQMFQYAAGRALSVRLNVPLRLDISGFDSYQLHNGFELSRIFNIDSEIIGEEELNQVLGIHSRWRRFLKKSYLSFIRTKQLICEPHFHYWSELNHLSGDCYLTGYWQSEKYFLDAVDLIRKEFTFKEPLDYRNEEIATKVSQENSISLHVRRGDYVSSALNLSIYESCSPDYYARSIDYITRRVPAPKFYIFSDDLSWVMENLKIDFPHVYIDINCGKNSFKDMRLMSLCQHHIIANSSFSWWGAWLNSRVDKIVIAPKRWFKSSLDTRDLLPEDWIRL